MPEFKYTPGPWTFYHSPPYIGVSGHDDYCVHEEKQHSGNDLEIQIANAKVMAASLDMLRGLQEIKKKISPDTADSDEYDTYTLCDYLIKKATQ